MNSDALLRPEIAHFEPYLPGRSLESVRRELGLKKIIKLASNENPLGPSAKALKAIQKAGKTLFRYPDGASTVLRLALAEQADVSAESVIVGAGSDEIIELLGKTFLNPGDSIIVSEHAFVRYQMAAEMMGAEAIAVPMKKLTHDLSAMVQAIRPDTKMIFIANPNNPTGTYNTQAELVELLQLVSKQNKLRPVPVIVIVDEAYYEYAKVLASDYPDTLTLQKEFWNLMVIRTFSKAYGLAGLRVGYGFAEASLIRAMDRVRPPFNVSLAGQEGALAALADQAHVRKSVQMVIQERKKMLTALEVLGVPVVPSVGNFFLMGVAPHRGQFIFEQFLKKGIIVRAMQEYGFPQHIRVTIGLPQENQLFLNALKEILQK